MAVGTVSQSTFLLYRFIAATGVLALVLSKQLKKINRQAIVTGATLAIPLILGIYFQTLGIKHTSASQCAFVAGTCVVIIPLLKVFIYKTSVALNIWAAALLSLAGLLVISVKENLSVGIGDLYTIIGAVGFAVYLIKVEKYSMANDILPTIIPMFATCALIMFFIAITDTTANWLPAGQGFWIGIAYCALFSTAYMYTVSNLSQRYIQAEKVAIIYMFEPVFAALAAIFMLGENLSWRLFIGGLLIFVGTLISEVKFKRQEQHG